MAATGLPYKSTETLSCRQYLFDLHKQILNTNGLPWFSSTRTNLRIQDGRHSSSSQIDVNSLVAKLSSRQYLFDLHNVFSENPLMDYPG